MNRTAFDKISKQISSKVLRPMQDVNVDIIGRECEVLKITQGVENVYGVTDGDTYSSEIINNVIIQYPLGTDIELFDQTENTQTDVTSINLMDILPIKVQIKFEQVDDRADTSVLGLEYGDILVDVLEDEQGNKIPIKIEIKQQIGGFNGRYIVKRIYEATLIRGTVSSDVEALIADYIAAFE
jgi:hypothetical protein